MIPEGNIRKEDKRSWQRTVLTYNILKIIAEIRIHFFKKRIMTTCLPLICTKNCQKSPEATKSSSPPPSSQNQSSQTA